MQYILLALLIVACCVCHSLPRDPVQTENDKAISKRSIPWFLPALFVPQVVEVHHIVYLQQPDSRCFADFLRTTPRPTPAANTTEIPLLEDRLGDRNGTVQQPSKCVWAIVSCCSPGSRTIRYACFELLGCQGAFWDVNPCEQSIVTAAANTALKFYMTNSIESQSNNIPVDLNN